MGSDVIRVSGVHGDEVEVGRDALRALEAAAPAHVRLPGDAGFDDATRPWNGRVDHRPAVAVRPESTDAVAKVVRFARDRGLLLGVRGAGHNIAGTSLAPGGVTIDMSRLRSVRVDAERRWADVAPGCVLGDVDAATQAHGLATVLGFVSETGVAGLTLGGGWGYLTRRFGWTVDNLQAVDVVTADGDAVTVDATTHEDLFWAVRGGGGNFGVVTRFRYRLHPVGPRVVAGLTAWDADRAPEILRAYREITRTAPRELTLAVVIRRAPPAPFVPPPWHGRTIVAIVACHSGDAPDRDLAALRRIPNPVFQTVGDMPYTGLQSMLNANEPAGPHRYWKTEFLPGLADGFLDAFAEGGIGLTSPISQSVLFHLGGALNDRKPDDGAVGNRDAHYIAGFSGTWPPDADPAPHIAWVRGAWESIRPYSTGGNYVNFQLQDDDASRLEAAYGPNFARLRRVKARYDPDNFFRVNRNVPPAG